MTNPCQGHAAESARAEHMKEAERLLDESSDAVSDVVGFAQDPAGYSRRVEATRAALLAHIQRGVVPEHSKQDVRCGCCGYMTYHREHMGCIRAAAPAPDHFRDAAKMMAAPAEVPMPKPVAYGFGNTAITGHTNRLMMVRIDIPGGDQYAGAFWLPLVLADEAHAYGVACRAAGEAAGYARGLKEAGQDAERYRWQPIDTAPRDGSYVLVSNGHGVWVARFKDVYQSGWKPPSPWQSMMLNHDHIPSAKRSGNPTHWMPLPAAPAEGAQE